MTFYKNCLGGKLVLQTIGDTPLAARIPRHLKELVLHSTLTKGRLILMGTDIVPDTGLIRGNAVSLSLLCNNEKELRNCFKKLSEGGKAEHLPEITFWGFFFGDLTDKFGNHWILNCK
jgi:PhnB protein